jgi:hypothetical protein
VAVFETTTGTVVGDSDLREALHAKRYFDVAGHYSRADLLDDAWKFTRRVFVPVLIASSAVVGDITSTRPIARPG